MPPVEPDVKAPVSDTSPQTIPAATPAKPSLMERFKALMVDYGPLAVVVNFAILGLVMAGFYVAFRFGFQAESSGAKAGTLAAAYAAAQVVKPIRLAAVFVLTPLIARIPPVARFLARNRHKWNF
ncbi:hypothetical protein DRW03_20610 [Corallococcus sp. H22C18031201]|nr:FAM210 family protein [Citreicoccus inhibens]RJS20274.1 hypothetical protein DRW03_20610 [Corallococcus sp. H22C18031201]